MPIRYKGKKKTLADIITHKNYNEADVIKWIDKNNVKFIQSISFDDKPLRYASQYGYTQVVQRIINIIDDTYTTIDESDDSDKTDDYDDTPPLIYAINNGQTEVVKMLIKAGANINYIDSSITPLYNAVESGNIDIVKLLIKAGVDVNYQEKYIKNNIIDMPESAILCAIFDDKIDILKLLIKAGSIIDKDVLECSILHANVNIVKLLIKAGINVDEKILNIAIKRIKRKNMDIDGIKIIKLLLNELMY